MYKKDEGLSFSYMLIGIGLIVLGICGFYWATINLIDIGSTTPNQDYIDDVIEFSGREPCCDMTWFEMCEDYKKAKNISFECFT